MAPSTLRFMTRNALEVVGASILNGVGLNAPARVEDPLWPMENLFSTDRSTPWRVPDGASSPVIVDIDLGILFATAPVSVFGVLALAQSLSGGTYGPNTVTVQSQATTYNGTGTWATRGTINVGTTKKLRDAYASFTPIITDRFWRLRINQTNSLAFSIGHGLVGQVDLDLGFLYSQATDTLIRPRGRSSTWGGSAIVTELGDDRHMIGYQWGMVDQATVDKLVTVAKLSRPIIILSPFNDVLEGNLKSDELQVTHRWGSPDLYDVTMEIETLP